MPAANAADPENEGESLVIGVHRRPAARRVRAVRRQSNFDQLESHHLAGEESNPENRVDLSGECGVIQPAGGLIGPGLVAADQYRAGRWPTGQYRGTVKNEGSTRNHALVSIGPQFLMSGNLSLFCARATNSWLIHESIGPAAPVGARACPSRTSKLDTRLSWPACAARPPKPCKRNRMSSRSVPKKRRTRVSSLSFMPALARKNLMPGAGLPRCAAPF